MIKFFRHIRQMLINKNRFGKYLLYAFGEIVLVVIGIMIALQINNKNRARMQKIEERVALESLVAEIDRNITEFDRTIALHRRKMATIDFIMRGDFDSLNAFGMDSVNMLALTNWTYNASFGIYDAITNSGKIDLISDLDLKNNISNFKEVVMDYKEEEDNLVRYTDFNVLGYLSDEIELADIRYFGLKNLSDNQEKEAFEVYEKAFRSSKYRNRISLLSLMSVALFEEADIVKKEMLELKSLILEELEHFDN